MECFNADLKADWERWQSNKRHDFKQLLTGMADKNVGYYEKVRWGQPNGSIWSPTVENGRQMNARRLCFLILSSIINVILHILRQDRI